MTETQAKSGIAGASTTPVDEEAASGGGPTTGRAAVGRAVVPGETSAPKFTRAPGMPAPPDQPGGDSGRSGEAAQPDPGTVTATIPVVKPGPAGQRDGRASAGQETRQMGPGQPQAVGQTRASGTAAVGAARVTDTVRAARAPVNSAASRGPRRARLNLKRIDPWSVMKFSAAVSVVLFIVMIVATSVLYLALDAMGVFESVNSSLTDLVSASGGGGGASGFKVTAKGVIGISALVGLVNVVLFTALATLGAFVYNVCADLVGGIELTLAERD